MVGTRSFMTGVDAPGETCTLVIVDRVPRAAGNVVDDARVELAMQSQQLDKWTAERYVYVADAALLLEQAAGRLIRSITDSGLFVCLDPRLVPKTVLSYPKQTSDVYLRAMRRFQVRKVRPAEATNFLNSRLQNSKEVA
jgi:ATP-dependent DNA helicase DinG